MPLVTLGVFFLNKMPSILFEIDRALERKDRRRRQALSEERRKRAAIRWITKAQLAFSEQLIVYRRKHNLTQMELGFILKMKQPRIAFLESGTANPTLKRMTKIFEKLGVEIAFIPRPEGPPQRKAEAPLKQS